MKKLALFAAALTVALSAAAQPQAPQKKAFPGHPGEKHEKLTVEQRAEFRAKQMGSELSLSDEQIAKIKDFYVEDFKYRKENFHKEDHKSTKDKADLKKVKKYDEKQEQKLRKILGEDNYSKWRASHPMKRHDRHHGKGHKPHQHEAPAEN